MTEYLSHLHDKGTYAGALGIAWMIFSSLDVDALLKLLVGIFTLGVLFYTILEKRQKIRLTKLQIEAEKKFHHIEEED